MSTSVKYFHSELPGAPVLSGTAGSRIAVLDACLVNGWGLITAASVSVAGGVATATFTAGHSVEPLSVIQVAGASVPAINGEQRVTTTASLSISWPAPGVADGPVSGTITIKLAPAGWVKLAGTNKAAYKSGAVGASGCWLQIDDSAAQLARVRAFDAMTDASTGTGPTPTEAQQPGGLYMSGSSTANGVARKWIVAASEKFCIFLIAHSASYPNDYTPYAFGDFSSLKAGDAYPFIVAADTSSYVSATYIGDNALNGMASAVGVFLVRNYTQVGGAVPAKLAKPGLLANSGSTANPPGPNPINNAIELCPTLIYEGAGTNASRRGTLPGVYGLPHFVGTAYDSKQAIPAAVGLPGHVLIGVRYYSATDPASGYRYAIDVTGPWE